MGKRKTSAVQDWDAAAERDGFRVFVEPLPFPSDPSYVARINTRWTDDWVLNGMLRLAEGRLVLSSLEVALSAQPADADRPRHPDEVPAGGVTSTVLRAIPTGRLLAQARLALIASDEVGHSIASLAEHSDGATSAVAAQLAEIFRVGDDEQRARAAEAAERARGAELRRGRKGYPDDHYRRIALAYLDLQSQGVTRGILDRIAEQEGRKRDTIRDWIHQAREREFLTKGTPGRAGAQPGPRLYEFDNEGDQR